MQLPSFGKISFNHPEIQKCNCCLIRSLNLSEPNSKIRQLLIDLELFSKFLKLFSTEINT